MEELKILFIRHGQKDNVEGDKNVGLSKYGREESRALAQRLRNLGATPEYCFTSSYRHARETALILVANESDSIPKVIEVEALTPKTLDKDFSIENIILHAHKNNIDLKHGNLVAFVGHESRLSQLITRMTGKRFRPLDHLDVVCVSAKDIMDLICGCGKVAWRIPVKAFLEDELRVKIASKMTVATLLAGFSFAALLQLFTAKPLPKFSDIATNPSLTMVVITVSPFVAIVTLTAATGLFIATVYIYDRLSMPEGFWIENRAAKPSKLPAFVRDNKDKHGLMYTHMIHAWMWFFTPAVILSGVGLLLIVASYGSIVLSLLCAVAFIGAGIYYKRKRPKLGVD